VVQAVILAGGLGRRLRPLTLERPKPLIEVAGKPIIVWQLEWLRANGITKVVVLAGYLKEKIIELLGSGAQYGVRLTYVVEEEPLGTGGALWNASHVLESEDFSVVVNGDVLTNIDVWRLIERVRGEGAPLAAMALVPLRSPYGLVHVRGGMVERFEEKPVIRDYWINAGVYAFRREMVGYLPRRGDIEREVFPRIAEAGLLAAEKYETPPYYWRSVDTHKDIDEAAGELAELGGLAPPEA